VNENGKRGVSEPAQTYGPPARFPGRTGSGCLSRAGCWQVFGLASTSAFAVLLLSTASQLKRASACRGFVLAYRCGAVPDSHRVPFYSLRILRVTNMDGSLLWHSIFVNRDVVGRGACSFKPWTVNDVVPILNCGRWLSQLDAGNTLNLSKPIAAEDSRRSLTES
jgi:hypothetical protein